jgi:hypothetical protein
MKIIGLVILLIGSMYLSTSCDKTPGYGGNCGITGIVKVRKFNSDYSVLREETILANADVYIVFQNGQGYGDKVKTSYDGSFNFNHLVPGDYTLFVYSNDTTLVNSDPIPITLAVKIAKNKQLVNAGVLKIADNSPIKGNASISGNITGHKLGASYTAIHEKVYLTDMLDSTNTNSSYTDYSGNYTFTSLPIGKYKIYVYSKNTVATPPYLLLDTIVSIVKNNDIIKNINFDVND